MVSISLGTSTKLDKSGGTLTGPLVLSRDPLLDLEAATRQFVLAHAGGGGGVQLGADLGGTLSAPLVLSTHLSAPLPLAQGGTGSAVQNFVDLTTGQTVAGIKAFTSSPTGPTPVGAADLAPKGYVDSVAQGLSVKTSVRLATAAALPANVYANGASGVGATLTGVSVGVLTVDGSTVNAGDRVLVQNEAAGANNGIYTCTIAGAAGAAYVLTRSTDMNQAPQIPGAFVFVEAGTANTGAGFVVAGAGPYTVGTTAITWTQFSGAGEIAAGAGLSKSGNTLSLANPVPFSLGGTGQATQQAAVNALAGAQTAGRYLRGDGTNVTLAAIQAADVPTLNQSTTGTAAGLSATLAIASGGTGATGAAAALANLGAVASDWCDMLGLGLLTAPLTDSAVTYQVTPGDLVLCLCTPAKTRSISTLGIWVTAAGATGSGTNALMLFSEAGVLIDQTGDMTAAFSSAGMAEGAMGGAHTVTAGTNYFLGFLTHFSGTSPHFAATGTTQTANFPVVNGHYTAIFKGGQLSVPSSFTPSSYTPNSGYFIMYGR